MVRPPSYALRKIIPVPPEKPIWKRTTPTALERTVSLINSSPAVLFARRESCPDSHKIQKILDNIPYRLVYLEDLPLGNIVQRRLQDLSGQWTVPHLFINGQSVGGLRSTQEALEVGEIERLLKSQVQELVYQVRPDAWARNRSIGVKSPASFAMCLQDSHKFSYVHRERWAAVKRHWGKHPEIDKK
ncbi:hypothetical protein LPJ73_001929 [Coemansia sp. RSA 2703]|nr:hypothetical protein LPJ73_001929 [Coemansia sp. RSA 2703]KAJ2371054.1 hypothetical protein IW150_004781 [Coemansia sp. RSA 2607]KAJ2393185.1 hypothetical protein GGI05_002485 [Coemansia sp. RSA 2603]